MASTILHDSRDFIIRLRALILVFYWSSLSNLAQINKPAGQTTFAYFPGTKFLFEMAWALYRMIIPCLGICFWQMIERTSVNAAAAAMSSAYSIVALLSGHGPCNRQNLVSSVAIDTSGLCMYLRALLS